MTAHYLWLEMVYLNDKAHESYAAELVKRAEGEGPDARLGDMVNAVRVHHRITKDYVRWFGDAVGFDEQELNELVLDAPHVKPSARVAGNYKLEVPKVDRALQKAVTDKKKAAGVDDFK